MVAHGQHVTEYTIETDEDAKALSTKVNRAIHDGWQPLDGVSVLPRGDGFAAVFAQAMVKYADRF